MNPWTFHKHSRSPDREDEFTKIAWEETPLGFEMCVTRSHETTSYTFSTEEQLTRAIQKWKMSVLADGFRPFMHDSPKSES
jgi:hypothetical protein